MMKYGLLNSIGKPVGFFTCELQRENNFLIDWILERPLRMKQVILIMH